MAFGLRVSPSGQKSFLIQFRVKGAKGEKWTERGGSRPWAACAFMTVKEAKVAANKLKTDAQHGIDPVLSARTKQATDKAAQAQQAFTFARLFDKYAEYLDRQVNAHTLRASELPLKPKRLLRRWSVALHDRPVSTISKADILSYL